ncbi:MAG: hypothetical protein EA427_02850 [Spirochaetaceae bacterium]|nr:MAG: hypothetical protein EA427_02850 [Spirochaetaceae bacterium]
MFTDFLPLIIPGGAYTFLDVRRGEPGTPTRVQWEGHERLVIGVTRLPRTTGRDRGGSSERYADRHWYILELVDGTRLEAYFMRRARTPGETRWWARVHGQAAPDE